MFRSTKDNVFIRFLNLLHEHILVFVIIVVLLISGISALMMHAGIHTEKETVPAQESADAADSLTTYEDSDTIYLPMRRIRSLNPLVSRDADTADIAHLMFSSLFDLDETLNVTGDLVRSYRIKDSVSVVLRLRHKVKFHDGSSLTAEDVRYTVSEIKKIGSKSPYYIYANRIDHVEVMDEHKCRVVFKSSSQAALDNLVFPIVPEGGYSTSTSWTPVGSGAYRYESFHKNSGLKLAPFKKYYGTVPQSRVYFRLLREPDALLSFITTDAYAACVTRQQGALEDGANKGLAADPVCSSEMEFLGFNFKNSSLNSRKVRQAICHAVDPSVMIADHYEGQATLSDSIYYPGFLGTENTGDAFRYDLTKALSLLHDAGYQDTDDDEILEDKKGKDLSLILLVDESNTTRRDMAEDITEELIRLGINAKLNSESGKTYEKRIAKRDFDILIGGFSFDKQFNLRVLFDKDGILAYSNSAVQKRVAELDSLLTPDQLRTAYEELKLILNKEVPCYCICYKQYAFVRGNHLQTEGIPVFFDPYRGIETWKWQRAVTPDTASDTYKENE